MGEAKRKAAARARASASRSWMTGKIEIYANDMECFTWSGTRDEAIAVQKRYLDGMNKLGVNCHSYAVRTAGYLMAFGMPKVGDQYRGPTGFGQPLDSGDIELYKAAILWLVMREHIPNKGLKTEDVFVGKVLMVTFNGDKKAVLESTMRELRGEPFDEKEQFQMMVAVLDADHRLDPKDAIGTTNGELFALAGDPLPPDAAAFAREPIYVPRVPVNAAEAEAIAMLQLVTVFTDTTATDLENAVRTYAGYTDAELSGGKPHVIVK
jgi:hypothetical protein